MLDLTVKLVVTWLWVKQPGKVVKAEQAGELTGLFLKESDAKRELRETPLWDNALVLGLFALLLSTEWVMRRGGGLP